jgi:hypothetical protein
VLFILLSFVILLAVVGSAAGYFALKHSPRRSEWESSLPPDCFVSRGSISHVYLFLERLSRKSNNVVVFTFAFYIGVQQPFKPLWSRLLLYDHEPSQALFALLCTDDAASGIRGIFIEVPFFYVSLCVWFLPSTCPAWETLLVAMLPPT